MTSPPQDWAELPQYQEPHRRGEVLVAIVLNILVDIWVKWLEPLFSQGQEADVATLDRARAAEEGARSGAQLPTMMIRGLDYLPPVEFGFGDLLDAVSLADAEAVSDDDLGYRDMLVNRFEKAGVARPRNRVTNVVDAEVAPHYLHPTLPPCAPTETKCSGSCGRTRPGSGTHDVLHRHRVRPHQPAHRSR